MHCLKKSNTLIALKLCFVTNNSTPYYIYNHTNTAFWAKTKPVLGQNAIRFGPKRILFCSKRDKKNGKKTGKSWLVMIYFVILQARTNSTSIQNQQYINSEPTVYLK